jgi:tetratricopeptide (TPR) repeat protein
MAGAQKKSYGSTVQARAKALLKAILEVAAEDDRSGGIRFNADWAEQSPVRLTIETTLKDLIFLVHKDCRANTVEFTAAKTETSEALKNLEKFVQILDDHRTQKRGSNRWHFSLRLWGSNVDRNLVEFDKLWESRRSPNSQPKPSPEVRKEPIPEKKSSYSEPKPSSAKNLQTPSGDSQGTQVNDPQGPVIVGSNQTVNIHLSEQETKLSTKTILILPTSSESIAKPRWREEIKKIKNVVGNANHEIEKYDVQDNAFADSASISHEFTRLAPYIVHISGCEEGIANLCCGDTTQDSSAQNIYIASLFKCHSVHIDCVVFSGCYLKKQAIEIAQNIKYVVGIAPELDESSVIKFLDHFYFNIASNKGVEAAYGIGKNFIQRQDNLDESSCPKLLIQKDEINRRDWEKELEICIRDLEKTPENITLWKQKASLLKDLGLTDETNEAYEKVASLDPENYKNRVLQGDMLESLGDHNKANAAYDQALKLEVKDYKIWWKKAIAQANAEEYEESEKSYREALRLVALFPRLVASPATNSDKYILCREHGITLIQLQKPHKSIQLYRTALWLEPNYRLANYEKKKAYRKVYAQRKQ